MFRLAPSLTLPLLLALAALGLGGMGVSLGDGRGTLPSVPAAEGDLPSAGGPSTEDGAETPSSGSVEGGEDPAGLESNVLTSDDPQGEGDDQPAPAPDEPDDPEPVPEPGPDPAPEPEQTCQGGEGRGLLSFGNSKVPFGMVARTGNEGIYGTAADSTSSQRHHAVGGVKAQKDGPWNAFAATWTPPPGASGPVGDEPDGIEEPIETSWTLPVEGWEWKAVGGCGNLYVYVPSH
jgi:hypothetical protein